MAYVQDSNDPNAPQQQQPGVAGAAGSSMNQPPQTAGGTSGPATAAGSGGTPQGAGSVPTSTQAPPVQDLKAYLSANAPQAVQMGEHIAGDLGQTVNNVTGDINSAQTDLNSQIAGQTVAPNADLVNQAASNPADFVTNNQNLQDFFAQRDANYGGPANFEATPYSQSLTNEVSAAQQQAPDITQPYGVEQLARGQEKNPTTGMSNLDALLLQENAGAMAPIQNVLPQFGALTGQLANAGTATNSAIQNAIAQDAASKAGVQTAFNGPNGVVPTFNTSLQKEVTDALSSRDAYNTKISDINAKLTSKSPLTDAEKEFIGYSPELQAKLGGLNSVEGAASSWMHPTDPLREDFYQWADQGSPNTAAPTMAGVANSGDYAKDAALSQLLGTGYSGQLNQADSSQAGSYNPTAGTNPNMRGSELNTYAQGKMNDLLGRADPHAMDSFEQVSNIYNLAQSQGINLPWNMDELQSYYG